MDGHDKHPEHAVGAVDEGEALLLVEFDGLDAGRGERVGGRYEVACGVAHRAFAQQRECAVRERREVARAAEASVLADDRRDSRVEQCDVGLGDDGAHSGAAGRERREPQQHRRPHDLALDLRTAARRMAAHERALQLRAPLERDVLAREGTEPGRDAVVRLRV